jgi:hypothetical protein
MQAWAGRRWAAPIAFGLASALALLPLACRLPNAVVPDDGYFYSRIAYELALRGWSTFDGVHTTSGYHLPWALVLAAASRGIFVVSSDPRVHLCGHLAVSMAIAFATVRAFFSRLATRTAALVLVASTFGLTEMVLAVPLLLALERSALTRGDAGREAALAAALALVRIDLACVPVVLALPLLLRAPKRATSLLGGAVLGAALQMLVMRACFGHFIGVAAWLKVTMRSDLATTLASNLGAGVFTLLSYAAVVLLAALALVLRPTREAAVVGAAALSFLAVHTCLSLVRPWYWVPTWLGTLHLLDAALAAPRPRSERAASLALAAIALVTVAFVVHAVRAELFYAEDQRIAARFLAELRARVPAGARLFTYDNPGFLGTFSGFDVIDGDGLVNDHAYARRLVRGELAGYLDEEAVCFVVMPDTREADGRPVLDLAGLVLEPRDVVPLAVLRRHRPNQADFALYELTAPRCARR